MKSGGQTSQYEDNHQNPKTDPTSSSPSKIIMVLCVKITSYIPRNKYDIPLSDWRNILLNRPSYARIKKALFLPTSNLSKKIGQLTNTDIKSIDTAYINYYSPKMPQ